MGLTIRTAEREELAEAYAIQCEASLDAGMEIGNVVGEAGEAIPAKFHHEWQHGRFLVAEQDGELLGFGGLLERENVSFLATCYVRPTAQAAGLNVGRRLLDGLFDKPGNVRCVVSSHVHRALATYTRHGMLPRWPLLMIQGESRGLAAGADSGIMATPADGCDPGLLEFDARIARRGLREVDRRYWIETHSAMPYWLERAGKRVGYGYIQDLGRSADAPWNPDSAFVGPVGVDDPADAAKAVLALVEIAREIEPQVVLDVPGSHPSLPGLLDMGFRIFYQATFCCSEDEGPFDPRVYLPADTITL